MAGGDGRDLDRIDLLCLAVLMVAAAALRFVHLDSTSIWWDELVHIRTAQQPSFAAVFHAVRDGIPPGLGNAGAVPLDYLALHAWLAVVPRPAPERLELYFRFPSFAWSSLAVGALYLCTRRLWGRPVALLATLGLAGSIPHVVYAAEVRFYSLLTLMSALNIAAFASIVPQERRPRPAMAWGRYLAVGLLYFQTGFLALLPLAQQLVLVGGQMAAEAVARLRRERDPRALAAVLVPVGVAAVMALALAGWLRGTFLGVLMDRPESGALESVPIILGVMRYYAWEDDWILGMFVLSIPIVLWDGIRRGGRSRLLALQIVSVFLALPLMVELARWKEYYVHPRHALFLLPYFTIVLAIGLHRTGRLVAHALPELPVGRHLAGLALGGVVLAAAITEPIATYLRSPNHYFFRTKTLRNWKQVMPPLAQAIGSLPKDESYLLIAETRRPGYLGNPLLAIYLDWYGLRDRVVLRGSKNPRLTLLALPRVELPAPGPKRYSELSGQLALSGAFRVKRALRTLAGVRRPDPDPPPVGRVGLIWYARPDAPPPRAPQRVRQRHFSGFHLYEPRALPGRLDKAGGA